MRCKFPDTPNADGLWECVECGWILSVKRDRPPIRGCKAPSNRGQPNHDLLQPAADKLGVTLDELKHYGQEAFRWVAAGCPVRTDAEVAACLAVCRKPCEHYREGRPQADSENPPSWLARVSEFVVFWRKRGYCSDCGCGLSDGRLALINAVRMKTFICKHGKWPV